MPVTGHSIGSATNSCSTAQAECLAPACQPAFSSSSCEARRRSPPAPERGAASRHPAAASRRPPGAASGPRARAAWPPGYAAARFIMEEARFGDWRAEAWRPAGSCSSSASKAAHMLLNMRCRDDKAACAQPCIMRGRQAGPIQRPHRASTAASTVASGLTGPVQWPDRASTVASQPVQWPHRLALALEHLQALGGVAAAGHERHKAAWAAGHARTEACSMCATQRLPCCAVQCSTHAVTRA